MPRVQNSSILATVFPTEVDIILLRARPATFDYNYKNVRKKNEREKGSKDDDSMISSLPGGIGDQLAGRVAV